MSFSAMITKVSIETNDNKGNYCIQLNGTAELGAPITIKMPSNVFADFVDSMPSPLSTPFRVTIPERPENHGYYRLH